MGVHVDAMTDWKRPDCSHKDTRGAWQPKYSDHAADPAQTFKIAWNNDLRITLTVDAATANRPSFPR